MVDESGRPGSGETPRAPTGDYAWRQKGPQTAAYRMTQTLTEDARLAELRGWLADAAGLRDVALTPASSDASFRRYFRVTAHDRRWIAMDAPPDREDCHAFADVAALMAAAGLHVPTIHEQDLDRGFMLLEDLGDTGYLGALNARSADVLFADALEALIEWQVASRPGVLPEYDDDTLRREMALFPEWYLQRHLGVTLDAAESRALDQAFDSIIDQVRGQPRVFVHRDYMPRNLMVCQRNPGVIDFQDARFGPYSYDLISLFKDAFISWPQERVDIWLSDYWRRARAAGLAVPAEFADLRRDCDWMGLQRHLKVLGIFARINYRDGKPKYLADAPRFLAYLRPVVRAYPALSGLRELLERHVFDGDDAG